MSAHPACCCFFGELAYAPLVVQKTGARASASLAHCAVLMYIFRQKHKMNEAQSAEHTFARRAQHFNGRMKKTETKKKTTQKALLAQPSPLLLRWCSIRRSIYEILRPTRTSSDGLRELNDAERRHRQHDIGAFQAADSRRHKPSYSMRVLHSTYSAATESSTPHIHERIRVQKVRPPTLSSPSSLFGSGIRAL